jgi:hypothetical protein
MMAYEDLMDGLIQFGRRNVHDLLIRSRDIDDVATYLWVELYYEMSRASTFETLDLVNFEKRVGLGYPFYPMTDQTQRPISRRLPKLNDGFQRESLKRDRY